MSESIGEQWAQAFEQQTDPYLIEADQKFFDDWLISPYMRLLVRAADVRGGEKVLEAGCASGKYSVGLAIQGCQVTALDYVPQMVQNVRALADRAEEISGRKLPLEAVQGDIEQLDLADGEFDLVFNEGVVEHWLDDARRLAVMREMVRVTREGGTMLVIVPNTGHLLRGWWKLTGYPGYRCPPMTRYNIRKLRAELSAAGCRDVQSDGFEPCNSLCQWPDWWPLRKLAGGISRFFPQPKWFRQRLGINLVAWGRK